MTQPQPNTQDAFPQDPFEKLKQLLTRKDVLPWIILDAVGFLSCILIFFLGWTFSPFESFTIYFVLISICVALILHLLCLYKLGRLGLRELPSVKRYLIQFLGDTLAEVDAQRRHQAQGQAKGQSQSSQTCCCPCHQAPASSQTASPTPIPIPMPIPEPRDKRE
jgi:cytochrome c553